MGWFYWITASLLAAVAAHSAFILAAPALSFNRDLTEIASRTGTNRFIILDAKDQAKLFPAYPATSVIGICAFDVGSGDVKLMASMPDGYWTVNVYAVSGDLIYAVNDDQAGTNTFTLDFSEAPGIVDTLMMAADKEQPDIDTGWKVESPDSKGVAVLLYPLSEPGARAGIMRQMQASTCSLIKAAEG